MHVLHVSFHATTTTMNFLNAEKAQVAYDKIAGALKEYQRFKNDNMETVEIEMDVGSSTLKLERMDSVTLHDDSNQEPLYRVVFEREKLARAIREEMGLPTEKAPSPQVNEK